MYLTTFVGTYIDTYGHISMHKHSVANDYKHKRNILLTLDYTPLRLTTKNPPLRLLNAC